MPGARCTRGLVCNMHKKTHTSIQVQRRQSDIPCAMVLRLIARSPRRSGFLVTVAPEKLASQELDAGVEASGPHDFTVRVRAVRYRRIRVHRIPPRVRDDHDTPLCGADAEYRADLGFGKTEIFLQMGLDRGRQEIATDLPVGRIAATGTKPKQPPLKSPGWRQLTINSNTLLHFSVKTTRS